MSPVSFLALGWYFAARLFARIFLRGRGLRRFEAQYGGERLFALLPEEKEAVAAMSRCLACGVCDAHFGAYGRVSRRELRAPSDLVVAHARSLPDWDALATPLAELEKGDLERIEALCPARIPLVTVAAVARRRAERLRGEVGGSGTTADKKHDPG